MTAGFPGGGGTGVVGVVDVVGTVVVVVAKVVVVASVLVVGAVPVVVVASVVVAAVLVVGVPSSSTAEAAPLKETKRAVAARRARRTMTRAGPTVDPTRG
ncbi:MAG TPA: hypothetical protein VIU44_02220 [Gaiellaceae bacterium]